MGRVRSGIAARVAWCIALAVAAGCAGVKPSATTGTGGATAADAGAGTGGGAPGGSGGNDSGADHPVIVIDAGGDGGCTSSVTCMPTNGRYCGLIGNGCFGMLDCGGCPTGQVCEGGICVSGPGCVPLACQL